jgi:prepilin-type N-terminal cleavage/methylation domain-containing protein
VLNQPLSPADISTGIDIRATRSGTTARMSSARRGPGREWQKGSRRRRLLRRVLGRKGDECGFTIVELMVAMMVLTVAVAGLAYAGTISVIDVGFAAQRQGATGLANRAVEEVRALPFSTVDAGLSTDDPTLSTDPNITVQGSGSSTTYWFQNEEIPTSTSSTNVVPLNPHVQTGVTVGTNTYTVSTYITYAQPPNTPSAPSSVPVLRVTAIASWVNPQRHGVLAQVQNQSLIYSPTGCQSGSTHPYTSPCQPFFHTSASDLGASITAAGPSGSSPISGMANLGAVTLFPTGASSDLQVEQVQTAHATTQTSGGSITYTDSTTQQETGSRSAEVAASNDLTSSLGPYQSGSTAQSGTSVNATGSANAATLAVTPSSSDSGAATATTSAGQPTSNTCANLAGQSVTNGQPCAHSSSVPAGPQPASMTLGWTGTGPSDVGSAVLASVGVPPSSTLTAAERDHTAGTSSCTNVPTGTDGCVHSAAARSLGPVELAELPASLGPLPPGWNNSTGLVSLTNFSDTVGSEAGVGAGSPTSGVQSGTVTYWNGSGYSNLSASSPPGTQIPTATVAVDDPSYPGGDVNVSIGANLTVGGTSVTDPASGCSSPCTRTTASAVSGSPVQGTITYQVSYQGSVIFNAAMTVNLGSLTTTSAYQQAPSSAP